MLLRQIIYGLIVPGEDGRGREEIRHPEKSIQGYERIDRSKLKITLDKVYYARSKLVHESVRLPVSIVVGHYQKIPNEALDDFWEQYKPGKNIASLKIPPLITLERLVAYTLVEFLNKSNPSNSLNR